MACSLAKCKSIEKEVDNAKGIIEKDEETEERNYGMQLRRWHKSLQMLEITLTGKMTGCYKCAHA